MELVAVDSSGPDAKNVRVTHDERVRVGRKLRAMRIERGLDQVEVARDPKVGMSVGTLQAIEGAWYDVRDHNIEKYAQFFGTSLTKLLRAEKPVAPTDPLLRDLNEEHLEVARHYMRARKRVRAAIELLLAQPTEQLSAVVLKLEGLSADRLTQIEAILSIDDRLATLLDRVRQRVLSDPGFLGLLDDTLAMLTPQSKTKAAPKKSAAPTRRA